MNIPVIENIVSFYVSVNSCDIFFIFFEVLVAGLFLLNYHEDYLTILRFNRATDFIELGRENQLNEGGYIHDFE